MFLLIPPVVTNNTQDGKTPFNLALSAKHMDLVAYFLSMGALQNKPYNEEPAPEKIGSENPVSVDE